ncbi:hypothetical protein OQJ04_05815 [Legionella quinlivanii]|nr:hypothetical protein [Legionella quinlivanii]MCW8450738.1 hypothetical protein [Legionella quinlivanii]
MIYFLISRYRVLLRGKTNAGREALAIEVDLSLPAHRVTRVLDSIAANRGYPANAA